jgi:dihydroorotase
MNKLLLKNGTLVNEGKVYQADILIEGDRIVKIEKNGINSFDSGVEVYDATGKHIIPGVIDSQVHFREPGLTHKDDIYSASRSAVSGGVTSFMEMPNTNPQTLTQELLEEKFQIAGKKSFANYSFFMGTSNSNLEEVMRTDPKRVCGVKIFMGASTGNMLVDNPETLRTLFSKNHPSLPISLHCEDENTIRNNTEVYRAKYGEDIPIRFHPLIRSEEACYKSSSFAVSLAKEFNTRIHILHLTTEKEMSLFSPGGILKDKRITAEVCIHHLWFSEEDYDRKGTYIKWNPAIKSKSDRDALFQAMLDDRIDVIATDHSPHTIEEKNNTYFKAPSGGPLVAHSLVAMLEFYHKGKISLEKIISKLCHAPAEIFAVSNRGYLREGYYADIAIIDLDSPWIVSKDNINYKVGYSPFEGETFHSKVVTTIVNGSIVYNQGEWKDEVRGMRLEFQRD